MSWSILVGMVAALAVAVFSSAKRRAEMSRLESSVDELEEARKRGSHRARLQYPHVDLSRCLGCGTCVRACPEEGVLQLIHGQAIVVHGARCVGHGLCARECPTGAIAVTLGDVEERRDIPALTAELEAPDVPGLFLAGEVTGYALVRTAIEHGKLVAAEVADRIDAGRTNGRANGHANGHVNGYAPDDVLDLCIVGAGPAGIACSLEAKRRGLRFVTLDQEALGGTVASYPRRKLVMTQPVELPLHGRLSRTSYRKEELIELWERIVREEQLPVRTGILVTGTESAGDGLHRVLTKSGDVVARNVCLALGRRGTPRKLGVPGEDLPKVAYSLLDAQSYQGRQVLVVGGGDSAVEAALGLADQPGNRVTLSYRRHAFFRLKARNEARLAEAERQGRVDVLYRSQVRAIEPGRVALVQEDESGVERELAIANDEVFVLAGGKPPFELLEASGVSFDPADRPAPEPLADRGTGLAAALRVALALALCALAWALVFHDYYMVPTAARPDSRWHELLRPSGPIGLGFGIAGALLILANLAYLVRRSPRLPLSFGTLQAWMTSHLVTGILVLLLVLLHAGLARRDTVGGHALDGLALLVLTGAIGRYFYSFVPRAANGRELALDEIRSHLTDLSSQWDRVDRSFGEHVQREIRELVTGARWKGSFPRRVGALLGSQRRLRRCLERLEREATAEGLSRDQIAALLSLARRAQRASLGATHFEELRGLLASWRYVHRWAALMMVLLVVVHVITALRYGNLLGGGG